MDTGEPHLSDREVASVIRKATELQERAGGAGPRAGTPLAVVREIAVDVGLDPAYVDEAAGEVLRDRRASGGPLLGAPIRETLVARSDQPLSEAATRDLLMSIESALDRTGTVTSSLGVTTWTAGDLSVAITASEQGTTVRVTSDRASTLAPTIAVPLAAGLTLAGAVVDSLQPGSMEALMILCTGAAGGLGVARALWEVSTRRVRARVQSILAEVRRARPSPQRGSTPDPLPGVTTSSSDPGVRLPPAGNPPPGRRVGPQPAGNEISPDQ